MQKKKNVRKIYAKKMMAIFFYSRRTFWNSPRMYSGMKSCRVRIPSTGGLCNAHTGVVREW